MSGELRAGAGCASIAPRPEDLRDGLYLGGFGAYRERRANGVHDAPQCRVMAVSDGTNAFALAALDLVGASGPLLAAIRTDAAGMSGLAPESIILACTHSHASPDTQGLWGGVGEAYRTHLSQRAVSAIVEAYGAMKPARGSAATTSLAGVTRNRRGWPETDETLTSLRFATPGGEPIGTIINYACHPTASGRENVQVSRDWCGYAVDAVEQAVGGVALYMNGAIGDVSPARDGGFEAAQSLGEAVAERALASLASADSVEGAVVVRTVPLEVPMNIEGLSERVNAAVARAGPALSVLTRAGGMHAASVALHAAGRRDLAQMVAALASMSERSLVHRDGKTSVLTHAGYLRIGDDVEAFAAPGEVLTRLGLPLRGALTARHRLFLGLAHDTLGYFVPEDEWMTGRNNNYEESVSLGRRAGLTLADALLALVPREGSAR
ncbi:MAG: hypothetical protein WEC75_14435 [Dehalococcoidia bacterium]